MWQKPTKSSARETIKQEHHCELMVSYIGFAYSPADHDPIQYLFWIQTHLGISKEYSFRITERQLYISPHPIGFMQSARAPTM